jgi:hypothetical protein
MSNHVLRDRIWESNKLARCSREAALAFPWILLVGDDWGRFEYRPRVIWGKVFCSRSDITPDEVELWLAEYEKEGLLIRYQADGAVAYWTNFNGRPPSQRRPSLYSDPEQSEPFTGTKRVGKAYVKPRRPLGVAYTKPRQPLGDAYPLSDQIRSEIDQKQDQEQKQIGGAPSALTVIPPVDQVFAHWKTTTGHLDAKLTPKRKSAITDRLREGYSVDTLFAAVEGCQVSSFHQGENKGRKVYNDIALICRDGDHVEQFVDFLRSPPKQKSLADDPEVQDFLRAGGEA